MKLVGTILIMITALCVHMAFAGNTNDIINRERVHGEKAVKELLKKEDDFAKYKKVSIQKIEDYRELIKDIKDRHIKNAESKGRIKPAPRTVVFVSLSMPELSLKQIIQDASHYQIPVVIRGLYKNSFRDTVEKIFNLVKEENKGGISINPLWFKRYDIKIVPAVVVSKDEEDNEKNKSSYDVVYGNIPLKRALMIIVDRGDLRNIAKDILSRGEK